MINSRSSSTVALAMLKLGGAHLSSPLWNVVMNLAMLAGASPSLDILRAMSAISFLFCGLMASFFCRLVRFWVTRLFWSINGLMAGLGRCVAYKPSCGISRKITTSLLGFEPRPQGVLANACAHIIAGRCPKPCILSVRLQARLKRNSSMSV